MSNTSKQLNKVAFFNILGLVVLNGLTFFTMPIFTRLLGTENYGYYTAYASYMSILSVLIGFQSAGAVAPASITFAKEEHDKCFSNIMMANFASMLVIGVFLAIFFKPFMNFTEMPAFLIVVLFFHSSGQVLMGFATTKYSYEKNAHLTFFISLTLSLVSIGLSLLFIYKAPESVPKYISYIIGHAIPSILIGFGLAIVFLVKGKSFFDKKYWRYALSLCLPLIFHQLANVLLHQSDKIMLKSFTNESLVGIYGFAVTFSNIINLLWSALNTTWLPFYYDDAKEENFELLRKKTKNYMFLFTTICIGFIMAMPEVVRLFVSKDFLGGVDLIPILTFGLYFVFLYSFPVNFEFYYRKTKLIALGTFIATILNIVLNYVLIPIYGMIGAAVATTVSYGMLWLSHLFLVKFVIKEEYHFKGFKFYPYLIVMALSVALFYLIKDLWFVRWPIFICLGIILLIKVKKQKAIF